MIKTDIDFFDDLKTACVCGCLKEDHCLDFDCCYWEDDFGAGYCFNCNKCNCFSRKITDERR